MSSNVKRIQIDGDVSEVSSNVNISDGFWLERSDHPLLNDLILDTFFAHVNSNDLKACRLVCKKWNVSSLPSVRANFEALVLSDESSGESGYRNPNTPRISDFVKLFESNTLGFPFTKFILGSFDPTVGIGEKFLQIFGKTAKKFDFYRTEENHAVENVGVFLRSAPLLESVKLPVTLFSKNGVKGVKLKLFSDNEIPELKNLRTLDLAEENNFKKNKKLCPTFFHEILTASVNISTLLIYDNESAAEVLKIVENLGRESTLETLNLFSVTEKDIELLRKMFVKPNGLKLKHLRVVMSGPAHDSFCFELIEMMKNCLISLQFSQHVYFPQNFPRMPNLQLLDWQILANNFMLVHENKLKDLNYNFPCLKDISVGTSVDQFSIGTECCPAIKSLRLQGIWNMNGEAFGRTINVCPNLTELEVTVEVHGPDILRMIWTQLQHLEKLNISGRLPIGNNLDSLFTGITDKEKLAVIVEKLTAIHTMTSDVRIQTILNLIDEYGELPSIRNLTNLRQLTLDVTAGRRDQPSYLTDVMAYLGLYSMKNLRSLNVSPCEFSKSCSKILVADLELESWVIQRNARTDIITRQWAPEKRRDFPHSNFSFNYTI